MARSSSAAQTLIQANHHHRQRVGQAVASASDCGEDWCRYWLVMAAARTFVRVEASCSVSVTSRCSLWK